MRSDFEEHFLSLKFATGAWGKLILDSCTFDFEQDGYIPNVGYISSSNTEDWLLYCYMLNTTYISFKHQQSKVDELQKQLIEQDLRIKRLIESEENIARGCESWRNVCSKLWKAEDAVTNVLKSIRKEIEHGHLSDDESKTLSSYANDLEQALKGGEA